MLYQIDNKVPQLAGNNFVADTAALIGDVHLAAGASVWFACTLRGDNDPIRIGEDSNIQDNSVLHTDVGAPLTIGKGVTVGHQVMLHGCTVGDNCVIGMGSVILNRARIGNNCIVGAGTLIPEGKTYPDGVLILGSPGVVKRELSPQEIAFIGLNSKHYVQNAARYLKGLKPLPNPQPSPQA
jgi:carbonic anhydrase/acetyltransferase-like protein (isoleucine patch superfamily)